MERARRKDDAVLVKVARRSATRQPSYHRAEGSTREGVRRPRESRLGCGLHPIDKREGSRGYPF